MRPWPGALCAITDRGREYSGAWKSAGAAGPGANPEEMDPGRRARRASRHAGNVGPPRLAMAEANPPNAFAAAVKGSELMEFAKQSEKALAREKAARRT